MKKVKLSVFVTVLAASMLVARIGCTDLDQAIRVLVGQRPEYDRIDDAEDGAVDANAEGQAGDGERGKSGTFHEGSNGVTKILEQRVHTALRRQRRQEVSIQSAACEGS